MCKYMCKYMYVHIHMFTVMPFRAQSGAAGGRGLPGHSQSLTGPVEVGYFLGAAVGRPKLDFVWQRSGSTQFSLSQSGSDCSHEVCRYLKSFRKTPRIQIPQTHLRSRWEFGVIWLFQIFNGAWCPMIAQFHFLP